MNLVEQTNGTHAVQFHNAEILCIERDGKFWVAVRPIALAIGLDAERAVRSIKSHRILGRDLSEQTYHDQINRQQKMVCLPIQRINAWLFSIDIHKVKKEVQPVLEAYQEECADVLFEHFFAKYRTMGKNAQEMHKLTLEVKEQGRIVAEAMRNIKDLKAQIHALQMDNFSQLNLFIPASRNVEHLEQHRFHNKHEASEAEIIETL